MLRTDNSSTPSRIPLLGAVAGVLAVVATSACAGDPDPAPSSATDDDTTVPVVLDYSPTVSDAGALLYLAANPDVDLLAVTLPSTGEADCEPGARITRALLTIAGHADVPIGCGTPVPADGRHEWPAEWREAANHLPGVVLPGVADIDPLDAEELLADVLGDAEEPVTVVAVGPLTNLAQLLDGDPALSERIGRIVTMGGAVDVPGNVESAPAAEWNYHIDPAAARDVLAAGIDVLVVPLDATDDVPWTTALISRIGTSAHPVARAEHQIVGSTPSLEGIYLWDELAAVAALHPDVVTIEERHLTVDDVGALTDDPAGAPVSVATATDVDAATAELLRSLNGGEPLEFPPLTDGEAEYFQALATLLGELEQGLEELDPPPAASPHELARLLVETMWGVLGEVDRELDRQRPPADLAERHAAFAGTVERTLTLQPDLLAAIDRTDGEDPWMILEIALAEVDPALTDRLLDSCRDLEERSVVGGGPELCGLFGE